MVVGADNVARRDPTEEQMLLPSGKPLVSALLHFPLTDRLFFSVNDCEINCR